MISILGGLTTAVFFATSSLLASRAVKIIGAWSATAWTLAIGMLVIIPFVARAGLLAAAGPLGAADKIKVLIVDGQNNHNWKQTTPVLVNALLVDASAHRNVPWSPSLSPMVRADRITAFLPAAKE